MVLDPPRAGCGGALLDALLACRPERIVYVSCNSATLARDLKILCEGGEYRPERICPVDMFPQTTHVETIVQLSKGNISTKHIRVEFDLENLDTSGFQTGATYDEIREWIQEKYGFHVSRLNIAQIKRKHGLDMRENYNLPKSKDSRQPNCPEEKEKAIRENPLYGRIICRCETVTEGEIVDSVKRGAGARDMDGVKRRVRAGMGRCQGGFCGPKVMEILSRELGIPMSEITKFGGASRMVEKERE